jgi:hypothetical protein
MQGGQPQHIQLHGMQMVEVLPRQVLLLLQEIVLQRQHQRGLETIQLEIGLILQAEIYYIQLHQEEISVPQMEIEQCI